MYEVWYVKNDRGVHCSMRQFRAIENALDYADRGFAYGQADTVWLGDVKLRSRADVATLARAFPLSGWTLGGAR